MAFKSIKVDIETLEKLNEIVAANNQSHDSIKDAISSAIKDLWIKTCKGDARLLLIEAEEFSVKVKSDQSDYIKDLTGKKGPYTVVKTFKSWVGLSDGVYKLKNCDVFVPVAWFDRVPEKKSSNSLLIILFALMSLFQSGAVLLLLL